MASSLLAHRRSRAYTGRDLTYRATGSLVGSADLILEKIRAIGVDHCRGLMFPANSVAEMNEQVEWLATGMTAKSMPVWPDVDVRR